MRLLSNTKLAWENNVGRQHRLALAAQVRLEDMFETDEPATELILRGTAIREDIVKMLVEKHLPDLVANTGVDPTVTGAIESHTNTKWEASYQLRRTDPARPQLVSDIAMQVTVTTDRPVNAVQAFSEGKIGVAEAMADH